MKSIKTTKATRINLLDFKSPQMRVFHLTWFAFFLCFFGWFAFPALSNWVIEDLGLTDKQWMTTNQLAVASTIIMRLVIGWLCDKIGPRRAYTWILTLGAIPVAAAAFVSSYEQLIITRILIGAIGAAFVITQYHTSRMFASNVVGTANATTAGWGNLGGGVTQQVMPLILLSFAFFMPEAEAWRYAMVVPSVIMLITAYVYYNYTQDTPEGNFSEIKNTSAHQKGRFTDACKDHRVWLLFLVYGSCFGIELLVNSNIARYLVKDINVDVYVAATIASLFGLMNLFARTMGGMFGDKFGKKGGLNGRVKWLFITVLLESIALMVFSRTSSILFIIPSLIVFSLFVQMAEGATYSVVPFVNKKVIGAVAGIVGAGGNVGAVMGMFLFKIDGLAWNDAFLYLGVIIFFLSFLVLTIRFSKKENEEAEREFKESSQGNNEQIDKKQEVNEPVLELA